MKVFGTARRRGGSSNTNIVVDDQRRRAAGSLIERLIANEDDMNVPFQHNAIDGVVRSIKQNLERALNLHIGGAASNPQLGIPDFNQSTFSSLDVSKSLTHSLQKCILLAEPRLDEVVVEFKPNPDDQFNLSFTVIANLKANTESEKIRIDVLMKDGHFYPS